MKAIAWILGGLLALAGGATARAAGTLLEFERATIGVFERVSPSVVSVANRALFSDRFGFRVYEVPQGAGSGFIWDRQGHIVSNFHVVYEADSILVSLRDGSSYPAQVVGVAPDYDLAVLRIEAPPELLQPVEPGTSADLKVGQLALAIGNPFGLDTSLSVGVVSALGRNIVSMTGRPIADVIQTDAAINPGNSGGPLLDAAGRLIGVNTAIVSASGAYAGIGFAVPVDTVRRVVPQLIAKGRVQRAGLGVRLVPDHIMRQGGETGAGILAVLPESAAARAGLRGVTEDRRGRMTFGDIVVELKGRAIRSSEDLFAVLDTCQPGEAAEAVCVREGRRRNVTLTLQALD